MEFLSEYGLFLAKVVTIVVALLLVMGFIAASREHLKQRVQGHISVTKLNDRYEQFRETLLAAMLDKQAFSKYRKQLAKDKKLQEKALAKKRKSEGQKSTEGKALERTGTSLPEQGSDGEKAGEPQLPRVLQKPAGERRRIFVLHFDGDIKASALSHLREEITAVLQVAESDDEVVVCLESAGGVVANYGLAASQLSRIRNAGIRLTVAVDKVAASGGYMMACVADRILAAPFAMVGSIGVVAQLPNFHRLLKRHDVDYELFTAGAYKRTVTMFGENTPEGREKFQSDLEEVHALFQRFVAEYRPKLDIDKVATGEVWLGPRALELGLVDELKTSDEYLTSRAQEADLFQVEYKEKQNLVKKINLAAQEGIESVLVRLFSRLAAWRHQAQ